MSRSMYHFGRKSRETDRHSIIGARVGRGGFRGGNAEPPGLHLHGAQQTQVVLIEIHRRTGRPFQQERSTHVIDVGMGDNNLAQREAMLLQPGKDLGNVVSRIDYDGFMGNLITQDAAIATQRADGKGFKDHGLILGDGS